MHTGSDLPARIAVHVSCISLQPPSRGTTLLPHVGSCHCSVSELLQMCRRNATQQMLYYFISSFLYFMIADVLYADVT